MEIYTPASITEWIDNDDTALCPIGGVDAVIGDASGVLITKAFLTEMNRGWF